MKTRTTTTLALCAIAAALAPAGASAAVPNTKLAHMSGGPLVGLSDNNPNTLADRRFKSSGIKRVRVLVPFDDVDRGGGGMRRLDTYFARAHAAGIEPLVSFYRSSRSKRLLPTPERYRYHLRKFRQRYPWVHHFSTWNEANFPSAQPTGNYPRRTAQFYAVLRQECAGGRCVALAPDFRADGSAHSARWLRTFKRYMGRGPHTWALVSHPDVNRFTTARTRWFLRHTRGKVWITEIGAVNFFGRGFRPNIKRQTKAMRYLMYRYPKVSRRIDRMYVYHWRAAKGDRLWDSGLLSVSGKRRPAYRIFFRALGKRAP